jgi:phospholipase C
MKKEETKLKIEIIEAKINKIFIEKELKIQPFITIKLDSIHYNTKIDPKQSNPKFYQKFYFELNDDITVKDEKEVDIILSNNHWNQKNKYKCLGSLKIKLGEEELSGREIDKWYNIWNKNDNNSNTKNIKIGEIKIIIQNKYKSPSLKIKKLVVLCLENRSFDNLLGYLDNDDDNEINGIKNKENEFLIEGKKYNDKSDFIQVFTPDLSKKNINNQKKGLVKFYYL